MQFDIIYTQTYTQPKTIEARWQTGESRQESLDSVGPDCGYLNNKNEAEMESQNPEGLVTIERVFFSASDQRF